MKLEIGQKFYTANGMPHFVLDITEKGIEATDYSEDFDCGNRSYEGRCIFQQSEIASVEDLEITKADYDRRHPGLRKEILEDIGRRLRNNGNALLCNIELWHDVYNKFGKYGRFEATINNYSGDTYMWIYR